jgi:co-chaperonin GroES (HSP10)
VNLRPLRPSQLIIQVEEEETQVNGIFIPEDSILPNQIARAVSVGKDVPKIKEGDRVLVSRYGGFDLPKECGERMVRIEGRRVYAVIR